MDGLINTLRHSTLTPEQTLDLFYATFEGRSQAEPCGPCAEAVLDAAGKLGCGFLSVPRELFAAILERIQRFGVPPPLVRRG